MLLLVDEFNFPNFVELYETSAILSLPVLPLDSLKSIGVNIGLVICLGSGISSGSPLPRVLCLLVFGDLFSALFSQFLRLGGGHFLSFAGLSLVVSLTLCLHHFEGLDVIVVDLEELLGVLASLIYLRKRELFRRLEVLVDGANAGVEDFDSSQNLLFAELQLLNLRVEVHLQLIDRGFEQDHLLTLLGEVSLLTLRHLVVVVTLEHEHTEGVLGFLDLVQFILVLVGLVGLLLFKVLDLLLSPLTGDLPLLTLAFRLCLVGFSLGCRNIAPLAVVGGLAFFLPLAHVLHDVVFFEVHAVAGAILSAQERLERLEVGGEELRHFGHAESSHIAVSA